MCLDCREHRGNRSTGFVSSRDKDNWQVVNTGDDVVVFVMSRDGVASPTLDHFPLLDSESGAVSRDSDVRVAF
jgi:hypothetical protein